MATNATTIAVLLGVSGSGKSATGNTIAGEEIFVHKRSPGSVTMTCEDKIVSWKGGLLRVIDTPGLFDTSRTDKDVTKELLHVIPMVNPGPNAFLLVLNVDRFTQEKVKTVEKIQEIFGNDILRYTIIIFTCHDLLEQEGKTLGEFLANPPQALKNLLEKCNYRHLGINNKNEDKEYRDKILEQLFLYIAAIKDKNQCPYYTCSILEDAKNRRLSAMLGTDGADSEEESMVETLQKQVQQLEAELKDHKAKNEQRGQVPLSEKEQAVERKKKKVPTALQRDIKRTKKSKCIII